jgi:hypothetical protein
VHRRDAGVEEVGGQHLGQRLGHVLLVLVLVLVLVRVRVLVLVLVRVLGHLVHGWRALRQGLLGGARAESGCLRAAVAIERRPGCGRRAGRAGSALAGAGSGRGRARGWGQRAAGGPAQHAAARGSGEGAVRFAPSGAFIMGGGWQPVQEGAAAQDQRAEMARMGV